MNLKVSLFNKSIFKTDIKRFWIASLLYTVLLFFLVPFQYVAGHDRFFNATAVLPVDYHMTSFAANTYPALLDLSLVLIFVNLLITTSHSAT